MRVGNRFPKRGNLRAGLFGNGVAEHGQNAVHADGAQIHSVTSLLKKVLFQNRAKPAIGTMGVAKRIIGTLAH